MNRNIKAKESAPPIMEPSDDISVPEPEETMAEPIADVTTDSEDAPVGQEKKLTTTKIIVWFCLLNGIAWVWCSYILAWMGKEQIAESLSQVALTEIIAVVLVYAAKSVFENLSKNNSWPDKPGSDPPMG